jgi:hypothetical protein
MELESNVEERGQRQPKRLLRVWKIPVPLRKGYLVSDLFKNIACIMTVL